MRLALFLALTFAIAGAGNCQEERYYVDPAYGKVRLEELSRPANPLALKTTVKLAHNGMAMRARKPGFMHASIETLLRDSGLIRPSASGEDGAIILTLNAAERRSWVEHAGPGRYGREIYELSVTLTSGDKTATKNYEHALYWYRGKVKEPASLGESVTVSEAVHGVIEQMVWRALRDLQQDGLIPAT